MPKSTLVDICKPVDTEGDAVILNTTPAAIAAGLGLAAEAYSLGR